jgi:hypothetical protein
MMHQTHPQLRAIVVFPQVLAQTLDRHLSSVDSASDGEDYYLPLRRVLIDPEHYFLVGLTVLEDCEFFVAGNLHLAQEGLTECAFGEGGREILRELTIFYFQFLPFVHSAGNAFGRQRLLMAVGGRRLGLLNHGSSLGLLLLEVLILILREQHFAESDAFDDTFGDDAHLLGLEGVVEKKDIVLLEIEDVDVDQLGVGDALVVLDDLLEVGLAVDEVPEFEVAGQEGLDGLLPLVNALDAVD